MGAGLRRNSVLDFQAGGNPRGADLVPMALRPAVSDGLPSAWEKFRALRRCAYWPRRP